MEGKQAEHGGLQPAGDVSSKKSKDVGSGNGAALVVWVGREAAAWVKVCSRGHGDREQEL